MGNTVLNFTEVKKSVTTIHKRCESAIGVGLV